MQADDMYAIAASFVDGIITGIGAVVILVGVFFADVLTGGDPKQAGGTGTLLILLAALIAFGWLYNVAQETSASQATLGKRLLGIKVANCSGGRISVPQSTVRFLANGIPGVNPILAMASLLGDILCLAMNSSTNRTIHDLIAGTVVIEG